jgi:hypothetical protein
VTAVRSDTGATIPDFVGAVSLAEDGTAIYAQNLGTLGNQPGRITAGGTTTFVVRSLAGPKAEGLLGQKPDDAKIKTVEYPVFGGSSLPIPQWVISNLGPPYNNQIDPRSDGPVYDWVQARTRDIFSAAAAIQPPLANDVAQVLSAVSTYTISAMAALGKTLPQRAAQSPVVINPYFLDHRLDTIRNLNCQLAGSSKFFTDTFLHEARHAYQFAQAAIPGNDGDSDWLANIISVPPTGIAVDTTDPRTVCDQDQGRLNQHSFLGPLVLDPHDWVVQAWEMDAHTFASIHAK